VLLLAVLAHVRFVSSLPEVPRAGFEPATNGDITRTIPFFLFLANGICHKLLCNAKPYIHQSGLYIVGEEL